MFAFEKLNVWKEAKNSTVKIYKNTANYPKAERYGLQSQIRRASVSVCSNIAEGASRTSSADQARFYVQAYSSGVEVVNHLILSKELGFIDDESYKSMRKDLVKITSMINRLHKATRR